MNEEETVSVSKGVFLFRNNFARPNKREKNKRKNKCVKNLINNSLFSSTLWYQLYSQSWNTVENDIKMLNDKMFSSVLSDLISFIRKSHETIEEEIPTAALLTGINMPDHGTQFLALSKQVKETVTPHVACLHSQDCQNIKHLMEHMIGQFINKDEISDDEDNGCEGSTSHLKKSQLNLFVLKNWYENLYGDTFTNSPEKQRTKLRKKVLVVILPDFESFNVSVLQKFILIASWYIKVIPFIFVFGIATSLNTLHVSLPYQVSSKINVKVFNSQPSTIYLNEVLENIYFDNSPFHLGGKVFNLFTDIFLFYDFSVNNFISNIKYAMTEHFCYGNAMALCTLQKEVVDQNLKKFTHEDFENVRRLFSFRRLVEQESYKNQIKLLTDDNYFREILKSEIQKMQRYIKHLHLFLKCLLILVRDLPKAPIGTQMRELYSLTVSKDITKTAEYKECFQLLSFQSKEELCVKLSKIIDTLSQKIQYNEKDAVNELVRSLQQYLNNMNNFNFLELEEVVKEIEMEDIVMSENMDRKQFKEKLIGMSKQQNKPLNRYEKIRKNILDSLSEAFEEHLVEPQSLYFHEIFFFDNISIQNYIVGTHRSAIHNALNDPQYYLNCNCCKIPNSTTIRSSMPDICIAYKLHLECGKMINLYDWLQAFLSIVDPADLEDDKKRIVNPKLQARFTQAVAELEYLGFIKSSKRKADHVTRLTWGG